MRPLFVIIIMSSEPSRKVNQWLTAAIVTMPASWTLLLNSILICGWRPVFVLIVVWRKRSNNYLCKLCKSPCARRGFFILYTCEVEQDNIPNQQLAYGEVCPKGKQALRDSIVYLLFYEDFMLFIIIKILWTSCIIDQTTVIFLLSSDQHLLRKEWSYM